MSNVFKALMGANSVDKIWVDDVFSAYTRTGTGASATVTTGINLSTKGGLVWSKSRSAATGHRLQCTAIGVGTELITETTGASAAAAQGVTSVSSTGHVIGTDTDYNTNAATYVDWVFANSPNFYSHQVVVKSAGSNQTALFPELTTLGMVRVKRTDVVGSWYIWHRSLTAGKLLIGETTAAEATLGHITVSGTTVTLVNGVIADGTYLVEAWAHDTSAEGIIQCGTFTTDASGNATVNLGWEVQYVVFKQNAVINWRQLDTSRGWSMSEDNFLYSNTSGSEVASSSWGSPTATGFTLGSGGNAQIYFYLAIRRPNKPPTVGTQVYNAIAANNVTETTNEIGLALDLQLATYRLGGLPIGTQFYDRLRGVSTNSTASGVRLTSTATDAETSAAITLGVDTHSFKTAAAWASISMIYHNFRRAPGVFDQICTTGTGANKTEAHNLTVAPELWLHKGRSGATEWVWGSSLLANTQKIVMPSPNGVVTDATAWNSTYPTASVISFGTAAAVNTASATYATYLWATLAGISKCFTYTGDGSAGKVIDCGFTTGARFVMIIRATASTAQDIFIWDTVRGIIAGNDPHLSLNTTAAEVTGDDSIDPSSTGFAVNQLAATNINVSGAVYIGIAIA